MIRDDYQAKIRLWAAERRVVGFPRPVLPVKVGVRRFSSYAEFNAWKRDLLAAIARAGGVTWSP
jgi:hypothetical protein